MRHLILNIFGIVYCLNVEGGWQVLGLNHAIGHFFQCLVLSFNDVILLRGIWSKMLIFSQVNVLLQLTLNRSTER